MLRPYPSALTAEERYSFYLATRDDPEHAALAAARSELADRSVAMELLRELASRYRIADREKALVAFGGDRPVVSTRVVSAQLRAPAPLAAPTQFGALVERCTAAVNASADKPTYNPKLFDWLCRASILPEANNRKTARGLAEDEHTAMLGIAAERLMRFAERCNGSPSAYCGGADKLIAQLINQQPVAPVPEHLGKISVDLAVPERAAVPGPAAAAAPAAPTIQTN